MQFEHLTYVRDDRVATITLNRPERLNAIARGMPQEIRAAVEMANADDLVHVILLQGAGKAFCAGYDLKNSAEQPRGSAGSQEMPWDPFLDFVGMDNNTHASSRSGAATSRPSARCTAMRSPAAPTSRSPAIS